ncbi:hypothetical protein K432DRAFT_411053 [Lepidopterella palustris CBS 459.81]|uniref:Uncharacterized protein n=1 Tax=Lepidopterella palustris CBS 459.81 TaxID=1314670 RepID=A0A8E2J894_9PEZI|nr:hypothetical protein K432DRAFT_411053 [Lepidopterella palustris CBS 459.81]
MFSVLVRNYIRVRRIGILREFPDTTRIRDYYNAVGKNAVSLRGGDSVMNTFITGYEADKDPDSKGENKGIKA